jgi:protein SCO1
MSYPIHRRLSLLTIAFSLVIGRAAFAEPGPPASASSTDANALSSQDVGVTEKLGQQAALDVLLRDEQGKPVSVRSLVNGPTILTLNYYRCGGICSPQLNGLAKAISHTNAIAGAEFRVITVSFDERDTPDIAAHKQQSYLKTVQRPIGAADWRFLTGEAVATRQLADSVGFRFKQVGSDFVHPGALMFLSPTGKITRYMYGTTYLPADLEMAVREAARGEVQPTINKWLEFCFSYDPKGRRYAFNVTRVAGIVVLGAVLAFAVGLRFRMKSVKPPSTKRDA